MVEPSSFVRSNVTIRLRSDSWAGSKPSPSQCWPIIVNLKRKRKRKDVKNSRSKPQSSFKSTVRPDNNRHNKLSFLASWEKKRREITEQSLKKKNPILILLNNGNFSSFFSFFFSFLDLMLSGTWNSDFSFPTNCGRSDSYCCRTGRERLD